MEFKGIPFPDDQIVGQTHRNAIEARAATDGAIKIAHRDTAHRRQGGRWIYERSITIDDFRKHFPEASHVCEGVRWDGIVMVAGWYGDGEPTRDPEWS